MVPPDMHTPNGRSPAPPYGPHPHGLDSATMRFYRPREQNGTRSHTDPEGAGGGGVRARVVAPGMATERAVGAASVNGGESDALGILRWGLRRYAWLILGSVILLAAVGPLISILSPTMYDAESLVIAKQQGNSSPNILPRYGAVLFDQGEVARAVAAKFGDGDNFDSIVPRRVSLTADQDSIVFRVVGHDRSATTAADIANVAAEAFVGALNAPGPEVGIFEVQSKAVLPAAPTSPLASLTVVVPVSLGAGLALGLAIVTALLIIRRPVIEGSDAQRATGLPLFGTVSLPGTPGNDVLPGIDDISGLVQVCRNLLALRPHTIVVVNAGADDEDRRRISIPMAAVLGSARPVRFVSTPEVRARANTYIGHYRRPQPFPRNAGGEEPTVLTVIDGEHSVDMLGLFGAGTTVLIVPSGISLQDLRSAAAEHLAGERDAGIVLVRDGGRRWGAMAPTTDGPASAGAVQKTQPVKPRASTGG